VILILLISKLIPNTKTASADETKTSQTLKNHPNRVVSFCGFVPHI